MESVYIVLMQDEDGQTHGIRGVYDSHEKAEAAQKELESSTGFLGFIDAQEVR